MLRKLKTETKLKTKKKTKSIIQKNTNQNASQLNKDGMLGVGEAR